MKKSKRNAIICLILVISVLLILFIVWFFTHKQKKDPFLEQVGPKVTPTIEVTNTPVPSKKPTLTVEPTPTEVPYISPVDFKTLKETNEDIYAWIDIPGTEISYPILQSQEDDGFYMNHSYDKSSNGAGSIMTEHVYNSNDFTDPVTLIYGHNMLNGSMFGSLQKIYTSKSSLDDYKEIIIYLPERELHFEVFACVPWDKWHILYNVDFSNSHLYKLFFEQVFAVREIGAIVKDETELEPDDQVIILSVCNKANRMRRFLVCAKLIE